MQESFIHFLWRFQYFNKQDLRTTENEPLTILSPGIPHVHAGPDFGNARLRIGQVDWRGHVEIHTQTSDWNTHGHQHDPAYNNVILHVVWQDNQTVSRADGTTLPTLVLENRADRKLLTRYRSLLDARSTIPCAESLSQIRTLEKRSVLDKALLNRLHAKADAVEQLFVGTKHDWEETAYQTLTRHFGFKTNNDAFLQLSQSLPLKIIHKHRDQIFQLEALLFGQAGLLNTAITNDYSQTLLREYTFLNKKYHLDTRQMTGSEWLFMRLRPVNFPTVRLAQLAALLASETSLVNLFTQSNTLEDLIGNLTSIRQSAYWQEHFTLGNKSAAKVPFMGRAAAESLLINAVIPFLVAYGRRNHRSGYVDRAIHWLEQLPAEQNQLSRMWKDLALPMQNAADSQAGIELYNHFCLPKRCLHCDIGVSLLGASRKLSSDL